MTVGVSQMERRRRKWDNQYQDRTEQRDGTRIHMSNDEDTTVHEVLSALSSCLLSIFHYSNNVQK